jgi:hypothetical protein
LKIDDEVDVRIIDYGYDFCEFKSPHLMSEIDLNTPILDMIEKLTANGELTKHIVFAAMLVQLSSTTTRHIYEDRRIHRMDSEQRRKVHPFLTLSTDFLQSMQGKNVAILREVLRSDEVRSVLKHYHGRRNGGTRRTLRFATVH